MRKKKAALAVAGGLVFLLLSGRIYAVNRDVRLPEHVAAPQKTALEYQGLEYQVGEVSVQEGVEFFEEHQEYAEYEDEDMEPGNSAILVVELKISVVSDNSGLDFNLPLRYAKHHFTSFNPFFMAAMNPSIREETFRSGDTLRIPYQVWRQNVGEEAWEMLWDSRMDLCIVIGSYPVKNELQITELEVAGKGGEM